MKPNTFLLGTLLAGLISVIGCAQSRGYSNEDPNVIHPDLNQSQGGSRSEKAGVAPLPKNSPATGTREEGPDGGNNY